MYYWGIYRAEKLAHSNSTYYATQMLTKAVSLTGRASKAGRLSVEASAADEAAAKSDKKGNHTGDSETVRLYRKLVKRNPREKQARIFLANALSDGYGDNGEPRAGQKEALAIFLTVLKEDPDNSGGKPLLDSRG
jgi:hypothetical protein